MGQGTDSCGGYELEYDPYYENLPDRVWTMKNHQEIHVSKMTSSHIRRSISLCELARDTASFSCERDKWDGWIEIFEDELDNRGDAYVEPKKPAHYNSPGKIKPTRGSKVELICHCGNQYTPRVADLKRGWAKSCSKRCAAIKRDFGRQDPRCAQTLVHYKKILPQ